ncbi:MAG TPA: hypothetical protein VH044_01880 [Polyangiaceae bacterium]|nr:hypothetical protein [Polyangiaceae bacterium]
MSGFGVAVVVAGCTFPSVTFGSSEPDGGQGTPLKDAASLDVTVANGDADPPLEASDDVDAGVTAQDADADAACDFDGTWGSRITIDVSWEPQGLMGFILAPGTGQIRQWVKGVRVQNGTTLSDSSVVCGIELPDFKETVGVGGETYGVRFPDSLFDNSYLPGFTVTAGLTGLFPGATYSTTTTAALLGLTMANPTVAPWPATITTESDMDRDGKPGVTVSVAQGASYSNIPVGTPPLLLPFPRASKIYLAIRQLTVATATVQDCGHMTGTVLIPQINGKSAIDSHILGCALVDGGDCTTNSSSSTDSQESFVDNTQPVFTPSGTTKFQSRLLAPDAGCGDVRAAFPDTLP